MGIIVRNEKSQNSTVDTHVGREGQQDLADSYEENFVKGLVIAVRIVCIRGSSDKKNNGYS